MCCVKNTTQSCNRDKNVWRDCWSPPLVFKKNLGVGLYQINILSILRRKCFMCAIWCKNCRMFIVFAHIQYDMVNTIKTS